MLELGNEHDPDQWRLSIDVTLMRFMGCHFCFLARVFPNNSSAASGERRAGDRSQRGQFSQMECKLGARQAEILKLCVKRVTGDENNSFEHYLKRQIEYFYLREIRIRCKWTKKK